jgi:multidrug resistance protein, MATE family
MTSLAANSNPAKENWWNRPCGVRDVLAVALPLIVSNAFWSVQWFVDRMFLSWYSTEANAAALPAGMAHWTMICLPLGIASYCNAFVAQYDGAQRHHRIGRAVGQGEIFGWIMTPIFFLAIPLARPLFALSAPSEPILAQEATYFAWLAPGAGAFVLSHAMGSFYTGRGQTWLVMCVNISGTCVNLVLDYALVFGEFGLPEMGIAGAALATTISNWFNVVVFGVLLRMQQNREYFGLQGRIRFDWELTKRMLYYGLPSALPMAVEAGSFTLMTMFVSNIGPVEASSTGLAFVINSVAFIPVYGISIAVTTLVGQQLGAKQPDLAARATWTAQVIALVYTSLFALFYFFAPGLFLLAHSAYASDEVEFEKVRSLTIILLRFVAIYCMFDAIQTVFVGALKGAGDTRFVLFVVTVVSTAAIVVGAVGQKYFGLGLLHWWWVLAVWLMTLSVIYGIRFCQGKWRTMSIIESEPDAKDLP